MQFTSPRATLEELFEFANKVREAGGGNPIDALMPAIPQDSSQCLIARNLNFNCEVGGSFYNTISDWSMYVDNDDLAERIVTALGLEWTSIADAKAQGRPTTRAEIFLPEEIGQVADDFDEAEDIWAGWHTERWDDERGEYVYDPPTAEALASLPSDQAEILRTMLPYIQAAWEEAESIGLVVDGKLVL